MMMRKQPTAVAETLGMINGQQAYIWHVQHMFYLCDGNYFVVGVDLMYKIHCCSLLRSLGLASRFRLLLNDLDDDSILLPSFVDSFNPKVFCYFQQLRLA